MRTLLLACLVVVACAPTTASESRRKPGAATEQAAAPASDVRIGRCTGVDGLEETKAAGFDYAELGVSTIARLSDEQLEAALAKHVAVGLPTPVAHGFLPAEVRVTGPEVDPEKQLQYVRKAFPGWPASA